MKRKKLFTPPHLYDAGGSLARQWFVEFGVRNPLSGTMERKRYGKGFAELKTKKARYEYADTLIKQFTAKLKNGWTPSDDDKIVYSDELAYHETARIYGRKRKANKNIRYYASDFLKQVKGTRAKKSHETYQSHIRKFTGWLEKTKQIDNDITAIDKTVIKKFFSYLIIDLKLARKTIKNYRITLGRLFHYLIERDLLIEYPMPKIDLPEPGIDHSAAPILDNDILKILPILREEDPQLYLGALLQYFCFIRPGDELLKLKVGHINFQSRTVKIPPNISKNREGRVVDIPEQLYNLLIEYGIQNYGKDIFVIGPYARPGIRSIGHNTLRVRFNKIRDKLGLSHTYKWYSFNHTGAGKLLESGATFIELMHQLGHSDIQSTIRYVKKHFGDRSDHIRHKFPTPPGMIIHSQQKWTENISPN